MIPVQVLAVRYLANASPALCEALGAPKGYPALGLLTLLPPLLPQKLFP